jgi:hypothetical protein
MKKYIIVFSILFVNISFSQTKAKNETNKFRKLQIKPNNQFKNEIKSESNHSPPPVIIEKGTENTTHEIVDYTQIFTSVEVNPEPPGGVNGFRKKISEAFIKPIVEFPVFATIIGRFVVDENGSILDIKILKETPSGLGLGQEYIRLLTNSPKWKSGIVNGRNVKVFYTLPIQVNIEPKEKPIEVIDFPDSEPKNLEIKDKNYVYSSIDINPEPPGGINSFRQFIGQNFRLPSVQYAIRAKVVSRFVVNENGEITDIVILEENPKNLGLGNELIRVLKTSAIWKPGILNGNAVKVYYTLPVVVDITEENAKNTNNKQKQVGRK